MNGLVLLPSFPEVAAELVAVGPLSAAGCWSAWQAARLAFRPAREGVRRVREQREFDRQFRAIVGDDRELRALARDTRGIGGTSRPAVVTWAAWCAQAVLVPACGMYALVWSLRDAAKRRKGGSK